MSTRAGARYRTRSQQHPGLVPASPAGRAGSGKGLCYAGDTFTRIRAAVDDKVGRVVPDAVHKFSAVHDNLKSENPEDWANAVHSCRRILQDLADALFPSTDEVRKLESGGETREIKLGTDNYINRLICYVQDQATSERFEEIAAHISAF